VRLVFDIEGDGLLEDLTTIHCIVTEDLDSGEVCTFISHGEGLNLSQGLKHLSNATELHGHNIQGYDIPALTKILGWTPNPETEIVDSLVRSRLWCPNIADYDMLKHPELPRKIDGKFIRGSHSLAAWGHRLGEYKGDFAGPWDTLTKEMLDYCVQDVKVNREIIRFLESCNLSERANEIEHQFAYVCDRIMARGWYLDREHCEAFEADLTVKIGELSDKLMAVAGEHLGFHVPGATSREDREGAEVPCWLEEYETKAGATRTRYVPFNPGSGKQLIRLLKERYGWQPKKFTKAGNPQLDEEVLKTLPYAEAKIIAAQMHASKVLGMVATGDSSWLKNRTDEGRVHGYINHNGAATGRCTHRVIVNVPARGEYGERCRSAFTASPGMVQVGADAAGIELRLLGHYVGRYDNGALIEELLNGDVHQKNFEALHQIDRDRNSAKSPVYALLYGAGDPRLGKFVGKGRAMGRKIRQTLMRSMFGLEHLTNDVVSRFAEQGGFRGLDGRRLRPRGKNSALNTLLQGAGAAIMKVAAIEAHRTLPAGAYLVGHQHDEMQAECPPEIAKATGECLSRAIEYAGEYFDLRIALKGDYKIGANWWETH